MLSQYALLSLAVTTGLVNAAPISHAGVQRYEQASSISQLLVRSILAPFKRDTTYSVQSGDTGYSIAAANGITFSQLEAANPGINWNALAIGQSLDLPAPQSTGANDYVVKSGDTGYSIAGQYGITFDQLSAANPGVNWNALQIGQVLQIPGRVPGSSATAPAVTVTPTAPATTSVDSPAPVAPTTTSVDTPTPANPTTTTTEAAAPTTAAATAPATTTESSGSGSGSTNGPAVTGIVAAISGGTAPCSNTFVSLTGNGANNGGAVSGTNWPAVSDWASFDDLWSTNAAYIGKNCVGGVTPNTDSETADIKSAISTISSDSGLDPRVILTVIMQESNGCVRVPTTNWGVNNPGLMQDYNGANTCNNAGAETNPCPSSTIEGMIRDGVQGTTAGGSGGQLGTGLVQMINLALTKSGIDQPAQAVYAGARMYNGGPNTDLTNLAGSTDATNAYAVDVANRLMGWTNA